MSLVNLESIPLADLHSPAKLGSAHFSRHPAAAPFFSRPMDAFVQAAEDRASSPGAPRDELCRVLAEFNEAIGSDRPALDAVERLRDGRTMAVVTGQQTAPLAGPLFTVLKAATALVLSRRIESASGRPCVALFWAEGDDHDAAEVSSVALGIGDDGLRRLTANWTSPAGTPIGDLRPHSWADMASAAAEMLPESSFRAGLLDMLAAACGSGEDLGGHFCRLMARLFSGHGLIIIHSRHPAFRRLWSAPAAELASRERELAEVINRTGRRVREAGFKLQVHKAEESALFFLIEDGRRLPLRRSRSGYRTDSRTFSAAELERHLSGDPAAFSPGVLFRPLLQDSLLPTVAYVAGVAEASYLGQISEAYRRLGLPMPLIQPRLSASLVEPSLRRLLGKYSLAPSRVMAGKPENLAGRFLAGRRRGPGRTDWGRLKKRSLAPLLAYRDSLPAEMSSLGGYIDRIAGVMGHQLDEAARKMGQALRAADEETVDRLRRIQGRLFPDGRLMERSLSVFFFLNKHGRELIDGLISVMPDDLTRHYIMAIEEKK